MLKVKWYYFETGSCSAAQAVLTLSVFYLLYWDYRCGLPHFTSPHHLIPKHKLYCRDIKCLNLVSLNILFHF